MNKKITAALCVLLCFISLFCIACRNTQSTKPQITASESAEATASEKTDEPSLSQTADETKGLSSKTSSASSAATSSSAKNKTTKATSTKKAEKNSTKKAETTAETTSKATTQSTVKCTVTIECKTILEHMDDLKKGHESFVPENGIILSEYSVVLKNGQSVYDALKTACIDNNIKIKETSSKYSTYIIGFNEIDEKDCGSSSGWLYFVNGSSPNMSSKKYIVKNNDKIVFSYTV